jgi:chemotaxis protein methyltransferase CheR
MTIERVMDIPQLPELVNSQISDDEFDLFRELIYRHAGIALSRSKKALLEARLTKRLRELGLKSFADYYECVMHNGDGAELVQLLDRVSTNETHFFREPRQFDFLEQQLFPLWRAQADTAMRARSIRVWSAGCSTGEEPYSLAMLLTDHFSPSAGWQVDILATDLSSRALNAAQNAAWPIAKANEIPQEYLKRFMLRGVGTQAGKMKAGPEIVSLVRFQRLNLNDDSYLISGRFDAIFCRNVLIYFDIQSRRRVIERLLDYLAPGGFLFVGHAESLNGVTERACHVAPTVYTHTDNDPWSSGKNPSGALATAKMNL